MWYSFIGTVSTILLGLLISLITEKMDEPRVMSISKENKKGGIRANDSISVFTVDAYRRKSQTAQNQSNGIANVALNIDE